MKLYKIEALRGLAAFYVLLHHTIPAKALSIAGYNFGAVLRFGQEAVILFFLLSGFVIHYSFQQGTDKSFKTYFTKRLVRIYIPLVIVFFVSYLLACHATGGMIDPQLKILLLNLLMLQDWELVKPNVITSAYMENTPLWSLSYEWWFYMLYFPIIAYIKDTHRHQLVFATAILATLIYAAYPYFPQRILMYLGIWWAGVFLSDLYIKNKLDDLKSFFLPTITLVTITCILLYSVYLQRSHGKQLLLGYHPVLELRHFAFALLALIAAILWRKANWLGFDRLIKPFLILAPVSYALYISHLPLMAKANYLDFIPHVHAKWVTYLLITLLFSWLIEVLFYRKVRTLFFNK